MTCELPSDDLLVEQLQRGENREQEEELRLVLEKLTTVLDEVRAEYRDVTRREHAWRSFQQLVTGPLWQAVASTSADRYRQQVADVLDVAVTKLQAFQLGEETLELIDRNLAYLSATTVSEQDVDVCENLWRSIDVDTIPTLAEAFEQWLALSEHTSEDDD